MLGGIIICDGDSRTLNADPTDQNSQTYPARVLRTMGRFVVKNFGVGFATLADMEADAAAQIDVFLPTYAGVNRVVVCFGGINDFHFGASQATTYARLQTYCQNRKNAGWTVIVCTELPCVASYVGVGYEAARQSLNTDIRNNFGSFGVDAIADIGNDTTIGQAGQNTNSTNYQADQIHLKNPGIQIIADTVISALASLGINATPMAFTNFCCRSGGSNLNAGTRTGDTTEPGAAAFKTYLSGTWVQATRTFTPAGGANPITDGIAVGDFVSIYPDAATVSPYVARITTVGSTTFVTSATAFSGAAPVDGALVTSASIGGAWLGPNAASGFPFNFITTALQAASAGDTPRINMKNDATYSITANATRSIAGPVLFEGYTTAYGDGGKAIIDGGTSGAAYILLTNSGVQNSYTNLIFDHNGASSNAFLVLSSGAGWVFAGCVFRNSRGGGFDSNAIHGVAIECEAHSNNAANATFSPGFFLRALGISVFAIRCVSHDNAGSNTDGFAVGNSGQLDNCISDSNGRHGFSMSDSSGIARTCFVLNNCDAYNNGSSGMAFITVGTPAEVYISNCNLIKNASYGISSVVTVGTMYGFIQNCGFGAGTQINTSGDTNGLGIVQISGSITYAANATPWVDPANGDFRINLAAAINAGRGNFTETQASYAGTIGYPDIGAAEHLESGGGIIRGIIGA